MDSALQTVCIVDDDDAVRDSMRALLESYGLTVRDYPSATAYLNRESESEPDCLVLDLHMPGMDGLELIELLRRRRVRTPAILITGRTEAGQASRAQNAGVLALLNKPVSDEEFKAWIDSALQLHGSAHR